MQPIRDGFAATGITITSDGWSSVQNRPLLNILAVSPRGEMFLSSEDTSGEAKTGAYIADVIGKAIDNIGAEHVIQVCAPLLPLPCALSLFLLMVFFFFNDVKYLLCT